MKKLLVLSLLLVPSSGQILNACNVCYAQATEETSPMIDEAATQASPVEQTEVETTQQEPVLSEDETMPMHQEAKETDQPEEGSSLTL